MTPDPVAAPGPRPPESILPMPPQQLVDALTRAVAVADTAARRDAVSAVVATDPTFIDAWAALAELGRDPVEAYAAARVGYHRGLDALRKNGWRGSGEVRWSQPGNRGFLRCLSLLAQAAGQIGEHDEQQRCELFLVQLDPSWPPASR